MGGFFRCSRCRRQKIKCSGQQPCSNCGKRNLTCIFDDRDNKILVTQGYRLTFQLVYCKTKFASYLSDLQARLARLERDSGEASTARAGRPTGRESEEGDGRGRESSDEQQQPLHQSSPGGTGESTPRSRQNQEDAEQLTNPMVESSKFMSSSNGRPCE